MVKFMITFYYSTHHHQNGMKLVLWDMRDMDMLSVLFHCKMFWSFVKMNNSTFFFVVTITSPLDHLLIFFLLNNTDFISCHQCKVPLSIAVIAHP